MYSVHSRSCEVFNVPQFVCWVFGFPATVVYCSMYSVSASSSASEGTLRKEMYVYCLCFLGHFLKSGMKVMEKLQIFRGSVRKVSSNCDVLNCFDKYLMFEDICITFVCLSRFLLCNASATCSLFMGGWLLSRDLFVYDKCY